MKTFQILYDFRLRRIDFFAATPHAFIVWMFSCTHFKHCSLDWQKIDMKITTTTKQTDPIGLSI